MARAAARVAAFLLAAAAAPPAAGAQAPERVDARLRLAARAQASVQPGADFARGLPPALAARRAGILPPVAADGRVRVLVRGADGVEAAIRALGGEVTARAGVVVAATIPIADVSRLAAHPAVRWVGAAEILTTQTHGGGWSLAPPAVGTAFLDASEDDIRVRALRQRIGEGFEGVAGQGVIVGIVDSGVDLGHPDFRRPDGSTRILYAWDVTDPAGPAPGAVGGAIFTAGSECGAAAIDAGACRLQDFRGHGTHVLGIAAGDGSATGNGLPPFRYVGGAPESELIVVKGGDAVFVSDDVIAGVSYVFERAAELGRPAVVVLALGTQSGPHDGTTALEQALDSLVGPGRILVATAGNQGAYDNEVPDFPAGPIHLTGAPEIGETVEHTLLIPPYTPTPGIANDALLLELWYQGQSNLTITLTPPGGQPASVAAGDTLALVTPGGWLFVDNASAGPSALNGDKQALILLFDGEEGQEPAEGTWGVALEAGPVLMGDRGPYHGWIVGSTFRGALAAVRVGEGAANSHVVTTPGNGDRVIAVGAHATRHVWPGQAGPQSFAFREPLGDIAFFSSPGPRRDGVVRPDVTAPGKMVVSAYRAGGTDFAALPSLLEADGVHAALLGTSMATPQVAGVVALLLQLRPDLDPEQVRAILRSSARTDAFVDARGGVPGDAWGFGKLDALAAARSFASAPGRLSFAAAPAAPAETAVRGRAGDVLPLLSLSFSATDVEPILVDELRVDVLGADTGAELLFLLDGDDDGAIDPGEQELAARTVTPGGADLGGELVVPAGRSLSALVALRLGGGAPNGTSIRATLPAGGAGAQGALSGSDDVLDGPPSAVSSPTYRVDLVAGDERVALSANPVRGDRLVVNYDEAPGRAEIFTAAGRLVRALPLPGSAGPGRLEWDLRDDGGRLVANGAYYLFLDLPAGAVRRTVYVLRP